MSKADRDKRTNLRESVRTRDLKVEQDEVEKNKVKVNDYLIKKDTKKKSKKESKTTTKKDHDGDKAMEDKMDIYDSSSEDDERNKMDTDNTSIEENAKDKEDSKRKKKHKKKNKKDKRKHKKHSKKNKKDKKKKSKKSPKEDDAKVSKDSSKSPKPSDSETKKRQDQVEKALKKESDWQLIEPEQGFSKFDLDANIEICEKKIKDGIYPDVYRRQLKGLLKAKLDHEQILNQEPDPTLSTHVKLRLFELKLIEIELVKQKDPYQSLSNVRAIIKAYREHTLEWTPGKVTYWTHGTRINKEPEIFDFEDFEALNYALKGYKGFWVEGYHEVGPIDQQLRHISYSDVGPIWAFRNHVG
ncbi:uncharacterized protein N7483_012354 [Penicillium malachiteum]|uniref:uncharacterized protein n=1 Tax=Penicillium malachiteum TaxID=1324776 RepID=UPI0025480C5B|nr:uncharacterized protein N7483_012354 [Penicillium malachiteum]KAJ5715173.1 hypothetical protein N7483_012354 [Penicillium malachiteum]